MKDLEYGIMHLLRKKRSSVLLMLLSFVLATAVMFSSLILNACDIYKARNEDPYSDYYRLLLDYKALSSEFGYTEGKKTSSGSWYKLKKIQEYFLDIEDYTAEIEWSAKSSIAPYEPDWLKEKNGLFNLYGITECMSLSEFARGEVFLTEGRHLNRDDRTFRRRVCMISEEVAVFNAVSVGDTIDLRTSKDTFEAFTVIGIYRNYVKQDMRSVYGSHMLSENRIYVPLSILDDVNGTCYHYQIKLPSDAVAKEVENKINEYSMCSGYPTYLIRVSDLYAANNREIRALETMFEIVQAGVIVISAVFIVMFLYSLITSRKRECGILFALGKTRASVLRTFLLECLICVGIGVVLSMIATRMIGVDIVNALLAAVGTSTSAEALRITTSDALALAANEAQAISLMMDTAFVYHSMLRSLWLLLPVFWIGFLAAAWGIARINVMTLLTKEDVSL